MDRYVRQETLPQIGVEGQRALSKSKVCIVGLGALGTVVAELLARAGVGHLMLVDGDRIELANLQRQMLYVEGDVGRLKADAAKDQLCKINAQVTIEALVDRLGLATIASLLPDLFIDCTDNMETRHLINEHCVKHRIPFVHGAAVGVIGEVYNVLPDGACFACVFERRMSDTTCALSGILNSVSATVAAMQVTEAIKILLRKDPAKVLLRYDGWAHSIDMLAVNKRVDCSVCGTGSPREFTYRVAECKTKAVYSVMPDKSILVDLQKVKASFPVVADTPIVVIVRIDGEEVIVHNYGELLFKTLRDKVKIQEIADKIYGCCS